MKKILVGISIFAVLAFAFTVVAPVSAWWGSGTYVKNYNEAEVGNEVMVMANTGDNKIKDTDDDAKIKTGDAVAGVLLGNWVNTNETFIWQDCGCEGSVKVKNTNSAGVMNGVMVMANTGDNKIKDTDDDAKIKTGDATAIADVTNVVNTNLTTIFRGGFEE